MLRANETGKEINWQDWLTRWHHQQAGYLPQRAGRFELMLDYVSKQRGTGELKILDLCSGPGSISEVALKRFPNASIVAVDYDPWLLEIGRQVPGLDRIRWVEADLRNDDWLREVAPASFDAVLSATALHWFKAEGGIFLNADHQLVRAPQLTEIGRQLRVRNGRSSTSSNRGLKIGNNTGGSQGRTGFQGTDSRTRPPLWAGETRNRSNGKFPSGSVTSCRFSGSWGSLAV